VYHLRWLFPKSSAAVMASTYIAAIWSCYLSRKEKSEARVE
jgi:hypothetical protein